MRAKALMLICGFHFSCVPWSACATDNDNVDANAGVVRIICAGADSAFTRLCEDLSLQLHDPNVLRVLPILGKGSVANVSDLIELKGIDLAFAQADVVDFYSRSNSYPGIKDKLRYVARFHSEEMHVLANDSIGSIWGLEGKTVNIGRPGTGSFMTASLLFDEFNIEIDARTFPHGVALDHLLAGQIDAMVKVDGAPVRLFRELMPADNLHFLDVPQSLSSIYEGGELDALDYPYIMLPDQNVETISVPSGLFTYNWPNGHPRGRNVDRFVTALFQNIEQLQGSNGAYDPAWREVRLDAELDGWLRFSAARRLLDR